VEQHTAQTLAYLGQIYDERQRRYACTPSSPDELGAWQKEARPALRRLNRYGDGGHRYYKDLM
jgi:hypothetical protein